MESKNKNALIGGLLAIVFVMAVGYAAFATQLNINATAETGFGGSNDTWNIKITNIEMTGHTGTGSDGIAAVGTEGEAGYVAAKTTHVNDGGLSADFAATLLSPSDSVTYTVTVTNSGSLDAKLDTYTLTNGNTAAITNTTSLPEVSTLASSPIYVAAGATQTFTITTTYNSDVEEQPAANDLKTDSFRLVLSYVQK